MRKSKTLPVFILLILFLLISFIVSYSTASTFQKGGLAGIIIFSILLYKLLK